MKKFAPLMIAAAAMSTLAGCVAESGDVASDEMVGQDSEASCANREGTNAMIALLANAMAKELGRWEALTDFETYRGYNNQLMVRVKAGAPCANSCITVNSLLAFQDSRLDQKFVFADGTKLSSWSFASRLTTGIDNQKTCKQNNNCPYEAHKLTYQSNVPGACDTLSTYLAQKPAGGNLANAANLKNALKFTEGNGPNPYIAFSSTASTSTIDPGNETEPGSTSGTIYGCTKFNPTSASPLLDNAACSCPGVASASKLMRQQTTPATPNMLYCVHY